MADPQDWQSDPEGYLSSAIGGPVTVTSGYRDPAKNTQVGGVSNSAHLVPGQAYDFVPKGMNMSDATNNLVKSGIPFDQIINEGNHIHVSFAPTMRRQVIGQNQTPMADPNSDFNSLDSQIQAAGSAPAITQPGDPESADMAALDAQIQAANAPPPVAPASKPQAKPAPANKPSSLPPPNPILTRPFGFTDQVGAHIPFSKDIIAGATAAADTVANAATGKKNAPTFGSQYQSNLAQLNANQAAYEAAHPILSPVSAVAAIAMGGLPVAQEAGATIAAAPTLRAALPALAKQGAKAGALFGGLYGAGTAPDNIADNTPGTRALNTVVGTGLGAATGAVLPMAAVPLGLAGRGIATVANKLFPSADDLATAKAQSIINNFAGGPVTPNTASIVPGSSPTLAESVKNPGVSVLQKQVQQLNPNSPLVSATAKNAQARLDYWQNATGTPADLESAIEARDKAASADLGKVFAGSSAGKANSAPVAATIQTILNGPAGSRPAVVKSMGDVMDMLDAAGDKVTDPATLYHSVRKGIGDLLDGTDMSKGYGKAAASQLLAVRDALDDSIESGAPGFKQYLSDYSDSSGPITSMRYLQGLNLSDNQGNLSLGKVQTAIRNITKGQNAAGVNAAKSVSDPQLEALQNIRDDLLRQGNLDLNKARGSDTVQNLMAQQRLGLSRFIPEGLGATTGAALGHTIAGWPGAEAGGVIGGRLGQIASNVVNGRNNAANSLVQGKLENMLVNPTQYTNPQSSSVVPSLNDILNSSRARVALATTNRLAAIHHATRQNVANQ